MSILSEWVEHPYNQTVQEVADRFGLPYEWARMHVGPHRCVDGKRYIYSCLVSDPTMDAVAHRYMKVDA